MYMLGVCKCMCMSILFAGFEGDLDTERKALLLVGHLNLALCHLKLQEHVESRDQCDKALKLDPSNEKGLFRRLVTKHKLCACSEGERNLICLVVCIQEFTFLSASLHSLKVELVGCYFDYFW
jgi:hypothetical protein